MGRKEREMEGRGSPTPHFPFCCLFPFPPHRVGVYRGALAPCGLVCSLSWPIRPISLPGVPETPFRWPDKYPVTPETLPVSKYHRHIYQSLPLNHFETPRHVRDLIRDSKHHSVTKSHNSYNIISSTNVKRADPTDTSPTYP